MSKRFERVYTNEQKDAMANAYVDAGIRPAKRVVELAAAGQLEHQGARLAPFKTNEDQVRHLATLLRKQRAGDVASQLSGKPHRDAIEALRQRLINAADGTLAVYERTLKRTPDKADAEQLRKIVRCVREAAALPGPTDPRPAAPGQKRDGKRDGGKSEGMAGKIIAAHRRTEGAAPEPMPATDAHTNSPDARKNGTADGTTETNDRLNAAEEPEPGLLVRERARAMGLDLGDGPPAQ